MIKLTDILKEGQKGRYLGYDQYGIDPSSLQMVRTGPAMKDGQKAKLEAQRIANKENVDTMVSLSSFRSDGQREYSVYKRKSRQPRRKVKNSNINA